MTGKKKAVLFSALALLLAAGLTAAALLGGSPSKPPIDLPDGKLAYRGDHIGFTEEEIREVSEQLFCCKTKTTYWNDAIHYLSARETLAYRAREAGLSVTDREVEESVREKRRTMEADLNYPAMIQTLTEPQGMTEEEYWASLPGDRAYRQELLMNKFTALLKEDFIREHGEDEVLWLRYLEDYKKTAVQEEHVREAD